MENVGSASCEIFSANELDSTKLVYGAIKGMLAATDDPYTTFFDPEENKIFEEDLSGTFEGIGAEIGIKDKILTIVAPLEGMPAERAGLRSGDKVLKINDEETSGMSVEEARDKMRGKKGTEVKLTVFREGDRETRDITVRRDVINVKSVKLTIRDDGIALLKVNTFGDDTAREFSNAVKEVASRKARGLILDLRDNPGGRLDAAIDMASALLPKGKVVVIEEDSDRKKSERLTSGKTLIGNLPTVILINEGSASASEILAAALRENRDDIRLVGKNLSEKVPFRSSFR
ncbi:MAG: S41 family peptidase [Candidatus Moraniibacteriota bacterium]|nr:MAG: S41 family peptidase [Candidatus Moranbacteria bacterium]